MKIVRVAVLAAMMSVPSMSPAAEVTPSPRPITYSVPIYAWSTNGNQDDRRRFPLYRFAMCALQHAPIAAHKVLKTGIASDDETRLIASMRTTARDCYGAQWPGFAPTDIRMAFAELRYSEMAKGRPVPIEALPRIAPVGLTQPGAHGDRQAAEAIGTLAVCVVSIDPADAHRLVVGPFASPDEDKRFDALRSAISTCGGSEPVGGVTVRTLRGYLADALLARMNARK